MNSFPPGTWTLTARWVFPVDGPPLERGVVTIAGDRIAAVEPHGRRAADLDLGDAAVLPGLVNAHTHLDLSGLRGLAPPSPDFTGWLRQVIAHRRRPHAGAGAGRHPRGPGGVPALRHDAARRHLRRRRQLGRAGRCAAAGGGLPRIARTAEGSRSRRRGNGSTAGWHPAPPRRPVGPGSVRTRPTASASSLFFAAATTRRSRRRPPGGDAAELELLAQRRGPFVPFLQDLGVWDPDGLAEDTDHVLRLLNGTAPTLFVHGNYLTPDRRIPANASHRLLPAHPRRLRPSAASVSRVPGPRRPRRPGHRQPRLQPRPRPARRDRASCIGCYPDVPGDDAPAHGHAVRRRGARLGRRDRQPRRRASPPTSSSCRCRPTTTATRTGCCLDVRRCRSARSCSAASGSRSALDRHAASDP